MEKEDRADAWTDATLSTVLTVAALHRRLRPRSSSGILNPKSKSCHEAFRIHAYEIEPQRTKAAAFMPAGGIIKPTAELRGVVEGLVESSRLASQPEVSFKSQATADGNRRNDVRDHVLKFCFGKSVSSTSAGGALALRLSKSMDGRSQGFLLVATSFRSGPSRRMTLWAFPRDEAFQFQSDSATPVITVLNDVFSKSSRLRKAALFEGENVDDSFWGGRVIDLQASGGAGDAADYGIDGFLGCRFALEGKTGTRHLATHLRTTYEKTSGKDREMVILRGDGGANCKRHSRSGSSRSSTLAVQRKRPSWQPCRMSTTS